MKCGPRTRRADADVARTVVDRTSASVPLTAGKRRAVNVQASGVHRAVNVEFVPGPDRARANADIASAVDPDLLCIASGRKFDDPTGGVRHDDQAPVAV